MEYEYENNININIMAQRKGQTGNPYGKPVGAKNKLSLAVKTTVTDYLNDNIDEYFKTLRALEDKDYVRCFTELIKLVVPRPINEDEVNTMNVNSELIKRLFNN